MSRWIDADALEYELKEIEAITAMVNKNLGEDEEVGEISMPMFTIRNIMRKCAPIDICFCKECSYCKKKRGTFKGEPIIFYRCTENNRDVEADGFCSWGEREGE